MRIKIILYGKDSIVNAWEFEPTYTKAGKFDYLTQWRFNQALKELNEENTEGTLVIRNVE